MADDDNEGGFGGMYEDGHWIWDDTIDSLAFAIDLPTKTVEAIKIPTKAPTGAVEFRDDIDLLEQIRFRRRYQRKLHPGQRDVITVQDVKDLALFTAPLNILSPMLINVLHLPTTERFIRALILCCQYYLQVADEMATRVMELDTKIRTPNCDVVEDEFKLNLSDLRILVAKEYCTMLLGGSDMRKFHHMGPHKKRRSLSDKDARLFETLLRMCVQIVWLALGRKSFSQIELEVNRLFKSEIFNAVEHTLRTNYYNKMSKEERNVLLGDCLKYEKKLTTKSPLVNEVFCHRDMDYRIFGLGIMKYPHLDVRLKFLQRAISGPEEELENWGISLGILGMPRSGFDTMLRPLPMAAQQASTTSGDSRFSSMRMSSASSRSCSSVKKSQKSVIERKLYPDVRIPPRGRESAFPPSFPDATEPHRACSEVQRRRWQQRLHRLLHPPPVSRRKSVLEFSTLTHL